ncbi:MAG: metal-sulfur cluster assembly factor [Aquabacterium sp.]|uniref:metal-sulfur cluster assembly factor n=1 Tax=Aquabacterium sp. TaxID=1872578 RepID=UPI0025BE0BC8|nr:metal-sulfur cluster assembly factor [Aquabacterium sp.]MBI3383733.1 metal-sulfur cluster assembly factor [Aquabacterium sp.]
MTDSSNIPFTGEDIWRESITKALRHVVDPEVSLSIVDVGLIYGVDVTQAKVHVRMTMTSAACPVTDMLIDEVQAELEQILPMETAIEVELVWEPPWTPERMSANARRIMHW